MVKNGIMSDSKTVLYVVLSLINDSSIIDNTSEWPT